jgi:hypothetical protein
MKSDGSGSTYLVSRAVEEPLEATIELGENIQEVSSRLERPLRLGLSGNIVFIILLLPSIFSIISLIFRGILGDEELTTGSILYSLVIGVIIIFLIAITITSILYLVQIYKFNRCNLQSCCAVNNLTIAKLEDEQKSRSGEEKTKKGGKHLKNPIFAVLDLEEETMHVIPQIVKMLWFCTYFISVVVLFSISTLIMKLTFNLNLLFSVSIWELIFGIITTILFIPALILLVRLESDFRYIHTRHNIIDSIRFDKDIHVPQGENQLQRLLNYLTENDPYIKSSKLANKETFKEDVMIKGSSGHEHRFDAYFSGVNILKEKSVSLGMPMGKFAVFIKVFKDDIVLKDIKKLSETVKDVCIKEDIFPLRIIALQWTVKELPDDVYEYVLENPILMKNTLTHIEIVAEDGEVYSFIPMISYGERVD